MIPDLSMSYTTLPSPDSEECKFQTLGKLMNDSHESCNKQFDCSHPKVNDLVQVARSFGEVETGRGKGKVYGSRVTGAFLLKPACFPIN
jgi:galactokinase